MPLIGITTYREQARWGVWDVRADVLHAQYADAVLAAGGVPVLLPPASASDEVAAVVVGRLDGLIVSGGADVDPARYGEDPHPSTAAWREDRDAWETALLHAADTAGLPTLGVCRGMQLMAVAAGGSLAAAHARPGRPRRAQPRRRRVRHHRGHDRRGVAAPRSASAHSVEVGCHHHQTVATHPGFEATAWAADGSLEAMERPGARFCLAVQWHPEVRDDASLFAGLVAAAAAR